MKAIHQLITYFNAKGRINNTQLVELTKLGFWKRYSKGEIRRLESRINESFYMEATGSIHGSIWGTDVYTSDSSLDVACVHAGVLQEGETGVVKVTMLKPPAAFSGTTRNGVTTRSYGSYGGAYKVEAV